MKLSEYFEATHGTGVLATADAAGKVNVAIYARPHFVDPNDDGKCAFIMSDRISHANVKANPSAAYLFIERNDAYVGKRLSLTMVGEEVDAEKIRNIRRRSAPPFKEGEKFLVYFRIDSVRPLIGTAGHETE